MNYSQPVNLFVCIHSFSIAFASFKFVWNMFRQMKILTNYHRIRLTLFTQYFSIFFRISCSSFVNHNYNFFLCNKCNLSVAVRLRGQVQRRIAEDKGEERSQHKKCCTTKMKFAFKFCICVHWQWRRHCICYFVQWIIGCFTDFHIVSSWLTRVQTRNREMCILCGRQQRWIASCS